MLVMGKRPVNIRTTCMWTCFSKDGQGRDSALTSLTVAKGRDPVLASPRDGQGPDLLRWTGSPRTVHSQATMG